MLPERGDAAVHLGRGAPQALRYLADVQLLLPQQGKDFEVGLGEDAGQVHGKKGLFIIYKLYSFIHNILV